LEAAECIGGAWRQMEQTEGRAGGEQSINTLEVVRAVRTCQNLSGQDETCLGLLLLHVGPNGDRFGVRHLWNITTFTSLSSSPTP
jgi:hypothetical protein